MAPPEFQCQTEAIINCLLFPERGMYEPDSAGPASLEHDSADDFDPMRIAAKLRELGDHYDETVIQPLIKDVQAASREQVATAFSHSVESLGKMWVAERAEVVPEKQLLKATLTLAVYIKKNCPDMTEVVQSAVSSFINNRLASWIIQQGGWEMASRSCDS